jgi:hypothetical protein
VSTVVNNFLFKHFPTMQLPAIERSKHIFAHSPWLNPENVLCTSIRIRIQTKLSGPATPLKWLFKPTGSYILANCLAVDIGTEGICTGI